MYRREKSQQGKEIQNRPPPPPLAQSVDPPLVQLPVYCLSIHVVMTSDETQIQCLQIDQPYMHKAWL